MDPVTTADTVSSGDAPATTPSAPAAAPDAPAAPTETPAPAKPKRGRPKGSSTARTTRVVELTLTVAGSADGEWQAELKRGTTWIARALPVTAAAVQKAVAELHQDLAGPIEEVIVEARAAREAKVAELEAQLEQARKALAELD
ncbi:MAG: hypothetical protein JWP64_2953 [Pseudonocardia sp.]|nr:hypothetical protein [Pseudonocardia sp.]MDT7701743.1 hypothetical protein [Pseudonocardiales bacterium]